MSRQLKILEYALAALARRKAKTFSLVAVYAFTIALLASVLFLTHALKMEARALLGAAPDLVVQRLQGGRHDLIPSAYSETISDFTGVAEARERIWGYYYDPLMGANYTLQETAGAGRHLPLLRGRLPEGQGECALGQGVASLRNVTIGDDLVLLDSRDETIVFTVVGIFEAPSNLLTHDLVLMTGRDLAAFFSLPTGFATDIAVRVHNPLEIDIIATKIKRNLPDTRPITHSEVSRTYEAIFNWRSGMILTLFISALVAFCILAWDRATGMSLEEKREIGILKAVGWSTADILTLKLHEGLIISLTAFLLGVTAGWIHVFFFGAGWLAPVLKGWSVLFPGFRLSPVVDYYQMATLAFFTVLPYLAVTMIPSWKAAVVDPDSVMRQ